MTSLSESCLLFNTHLPSMSLYVMVMRDKYVKSQTWQQTLWTCKLQSKQQHSAFTVPTLQSSSAAVFPFPQAPVGKVRTSTRGMSKRGNDVSFVIFLHKGGKWVIHTEGPQPGATWLSSYDYFWIGGRCKLAKSCQESWIMEGNVFAMTLRRWIVHRAIVTYEQYDWAMPLSMRVWMVYILVMINLGHCNHNQPPELYMCLMRITCMRKKIIVLHLQKAGFPDPQLTFWI